MTDYNVNEFLKNVFDHEDSFWKPSDKIPLIIKELELRKGELKTFLLTSSYDIQKVITESEELCSESSILVGSLEKCKKEIEEETMAEIVKSIENYDTISKELHCISFAANLVGEVIQCGQYIKLFDEGRKQQSFARSVEAVCDLMQLLRLPTDGFMYLDIATKTTETAQLILDNLIQELNSEWSRFLYWEVKPSTQKTEVNITIKSTESINFFDLLRALNVSDNLWGKISELSQFLFKDVIKPIVNNECGVVIESDDTVSITISHPENNSIKPIYDDVIGNLKQLFQFLCKKLDIKFKDGINDITPMTMLGKSMKHEFANLLIEDCFIDTIPNNIADLQSYNRITAHIEEFQSFLVSVKFFPSDNSISILKYIDDIDNLFADKASTHLLEQARDIMLKDLSDTMSIGVESIPLEASSSTNENEALDILEKTIPKSLFYFPRCMISKSAQELLDLVHMMMEQAVLCPEPVCKKLYSTTRLIFELYDAVVPYHHEKYLQTIPQYVALFHNNCMFLAHNMQTFGDQWVASLQRPVPYPLSFVDLVQKLRELGYKHLTIHLQQQRNTILDNIRSSDLNCIVVKDELGENAEAAIRQCLRQLQVLKNVWIGVFPANVYTRLMATLVNMFVEELIHRVCTVEDISMEMATQLTDMYTLVVQKAPTLFPVPAVTTFGGKLVAEERLLSSEEMQKRVPMWIKLQELIFVLGGSLRDIENHWNEGNGPLARHFRTEELRNLIKALFQNTQIRANLLSKIK